MKYLKSSFHDLREVFDRSVSVRYVAEPFITFDAQNSAHDILAFMKSRDFDIVGVRQHGTVVGYVHQADLQEGTLERYVKTFDEQFLIEDWKPLLKVLELLTKTSHIFVVVMGEVIGIVTKGDLQKAPVRMWLFGVLSLLEMQFLRLIRTMYPQNSWKSIISEVRLKSAEKVLSDRKSRNEAIDLADCLQWADKREIVLDSDFLREKLGFSSKKKGEELLKKLEYLRNELAHAQDIITGRWPELFEFARQAEELLITCENFKAGVAN